MFKQQLEYITYFIRSHDALFLTAEGIMWATALAVLASVIYKFIEYRESAKEKSGEKKHVVETFSMAFVIIIIFNILQAGFGAFTPDFITRLFCLVFGSMLALIGTVLHIWSKSEIGKYWSNQIEILKGHKLVTTGPYEIVRHPMYSSLIIWMLGLCFMFTNWAALLGLAFIYVPMMIFRAGAEDKMLRQADKAAFDIYSANTHQLVPRFRDPVALALRLCVVAMLGFSLVTRQTDLARMVFLMSAHFIAGLISYVPKVRFSYMNKSVIMLVFYGIYLFFQPAYWLFYLIVIFDIWGLFADCPCMFIYEKYKGCPCVDFVKKCVYKK